MEEIYIKTNFSFEDPFIHPKIPTVNGEEKNVKQRGSGLAIIHSTIFYVTVKPDPLSDRETTIASPVCFGS